MRFFWLTGLLVAGCDAIGSGDTAPNQIYPPPVSGCPEGMSKASDSELVALTFSYDNLGWTIGHDGSRVYDGEAAACVSDDGLRMRLLFEAGGDYVGSLTVEVAETGSFDLDDPDSSASFEFVLDGFDPATTWTPYEPVWQSGVIVVNALEPVEMSLQGAGFLDSHTFSFLMNVRVAR